MKVLAINGSPKSNGNTATAIDVMKKVFEEKNIEVEVVTIGNENVRGCIGCGRCYSAGNGKCEAFDDIVNTVIEKVESADAIIIGSPVYFSGVNGTMKSFLDRFFYAGNSKGIFKHKIGAAVVAVRRTGGSETFFDLMKFLTYAQMVIPTSTYWNVIHGRTPGEALKDAEGVQTMQTLADNMAYMMEVMKESKVEKPVERKKAFTHFIRD